MFLVNTSSSSTMYTDSLSSIDNFCLFGVFTIYFDDTFFIDWEFWELFDLIED